MRRASLALVCLTGLATFTGCISSDEDDDGDDPVCGDGVIEGTEACEGTDLGGQSCEGLGLGSGTLACTNDCRYDTAGCACQQDCTGRECGPDPNCGVSCGPCDTGQSCNLDGQCVTGEPGYPVIISFTTNVSSISQYESVTFTAVVTDPDGAADLLGGTLSAPGGSTYKSFESTGTPGTFSLVLSWDEINFVQAINFTSTDSRSFVGTFYDVASHQTTATVAITLTCYGIAACDGYCVDLMTDRNNCGYCGNVIPYAQNCVDGVPTCPYEGQELCGDSCVDVMNDVYNCGYCGNNCYAYAGDWSCYSGQCGTIIYPVNGNYYTDTTTTLYSCSYHCSAAGYSCSGTYDWPAYWSSMANCGTAAGCFLYDSSTTSTSCTYGLSCSTVPTRNTGCYYYYYQYCFCTP